MAKFNQTFRFLDARATRTREGAPPPPPRKFGLFKNVQGLWLLMLLLVAVPHLDGWGQTNPPCYQQLPPVNVVNAGVLPAGVIVWDQPTLVTGPVFLQAGTTLRIECAVVYFGVQGTIRVDEGNRLIVRGSFLRADPNTGTSWRGIVVGGIIDQPHPADYYQNGSPNHGVVIFEKSHMEDAVTGIFAYDVVDEPGNDFGGGIIYVENSSFRNNLQSINMGHFWGGVQRSRITNSLFQNDTPFIDPSEPSEYIHLYMEHCGPVVISGNTFRATGGGLQDEARGTGILVLVAPLDIGANANGDIAPNTFEGLFKGVDVVGDGFFGGMVAVTKIRGNQFTNVRKGVTLSFTALTRVEGNHFEVPPGSFEYDTYAILTNHGFGYKIIGNQIKYGFTLFNWHTKGIVIQSSSAEIPSPNFIAARTLITDNAFIGPFTAATQFEGFNLLLQMHCNAYVPLLNFDAWQFAPRYDWYLSPTNFLEIQGNCQFNEPDLAFSNSWHITSPDDLQHKHIRNDGAASVWLKHDFVSAPNLDFCTGTTLLQDCSGGDPNFVAACSVEITADDLDWGSTAGLLDCNDKLDEKIIYLIETGNEEGLKLLLDCVQETWSHKSLTSIYTNDRDFDKAIDELEKIPDDTQDNIDFKTMYYAYIAGQTGSGKQALQYEPARQLADNEYSPLQAVAQANLALWTGKTYTRSSAKITGVEVREQASGEEPFILLPNPATGSTVQVLMPTPLDESGTLSLWSADGRMVRSLPFAPNSNTLSIDVADLPKGVYYCKISGIEKAAKLVLIH